MTRAKGKIIIWRKNVSMDTFMKATEEIIKQEERRNKDKVKMYKSLLDTYKTVHEREYRRLCELQLLEVSRKEQEYKYYSAEMRRIKNFLYNLGVDKKDII